MDINPNPYRLTEDTLVLQRNLTTRRKASAYWKNIRALILHLEDDHELVGKIENELRQSGRSKYSVWSLEINDD